MPQGRARISALAEEICEHIDAKTQGISPRGRARITRGVIEHVSFWHSMSRGPTPRKYHRITCHLYVDPANVAYGKGENLEPCGLCNPDQS